MIRTRSYTAAAVAILALSFASIANAAVPQHVPRPTINAFVGLPNIVSTLKVGVNTVDWATVDIKSILAPVTLKPAQAINPTTTYPYGADNGEQVWIDSATGPQTVKFAPIIATTGGSPNTIIAAVAGSKIRVLGMYLTNSIANGTVQFFDTAGSPVNLTGVMTFAANGSIPPFVTKFGVMDTGVGLGITMTVVGSSNVVGGWIIYCLH